MAKRTEDSIEKESMRYLMKLVSEKMKLIRGKIRKAFGDGGKAPSHDEIVAYGDVIDGFMGRSFSNEKKEIEEHKEDYPAHSKLPDFNFFDLETLYSFLIYLDFLDRRIYKNSKIFGSVNNRCFDKSLDETNGFFSDYKRQESSGYYKGYAKLARGERGILAPTRTQNSKVDMSREREYLDFISEYLSQSLNRNVDVSDRINGMWFPDSARKKSSSVYTPSPRTKSCIGGVREAAEMAETHTTEEDKTKNAVTNEDNEDSSRKISYVIGGKEIVLSIIKEEKFFTENGRPVYRYWAVSEDGSMLIRTVDLRNVVYEGYLYNGDGELVYMTEESGETFRPSYQLQQRLSMTFKKNDDKISFTYENEDGIIITRRPDAGDCPETYSDNNFNKNPDDSLTASGEIEKTVVDD